MEALHEPRPAEPAASLSITSRRIVLSANTSWNLANFRSGLIKGLQRHGYEIVAVAPHDEHAARLSAMGCRFEPIEIDNKGVNPGRDLALVARYRRILQRERPCAYLGFTIKPNVYGSLAAQSLAVPVVNNISGLGTAFIRRSWLTGVVKAFYRTALRRSEIVFFQNEDDRELFVGMRLVSRAQTDVLPGSGIDPSAFSPVAPAAATSSEGARFLLIARLLWDKGVGEYVEAARIVKRQVPSATFQMLGFLDVANRTAVSRSQINAWVDEGLVEYLGATEDVRPYIAAASCIVLPSYREGTPRTLLEAAAMAKPLIATDVPGCRNVVEHTSNGFLCRPRDASSLANQMLQFLSLPPAAVAEMGRRSRAKIEAEFDESRVIDRYVKALAAVATRADWAPA